MRIGDHEFDLEHKSYIMGILNVTPDSFSDGGKYRSRDAALDHAIKMVEEGASIIDIGGESTRPGYEEVSVQEEIDRVLPVIEAIRKNIDIPISLDTWKYEVAEAGLGAGVHMINDIWGLRRDGGEMAALIAKTGTPCCLMHNRTDIHPCEDRDYLKVLSEDIDKILETADLAGISRDRIILDPGIGFGKTYRQNLLVLKHLSMMQDRKLPVLLGTSNKSVIGNALDLPVHERREGTLATTVMGRMAGVSIFRVHDVKACRRALQMVDTIQAV